MNIKNTSDANLLHLNHDVANDIDATVRVDNNLNKRMIFKEV